MPVVEKGEAGAWESPQLEPGAGSLVPGGRRAWLVGSSSWREQARGSSRAASITLIARAARSLAGASWGS